MKSNRKFIALAAITMLGFGTGSVMAAGSGGNEAYPRPEPGMGYKFGRGVVNVLTCWTEIPRNVALEWQRTDPASGFFLGVGKGIGYTYARFAGGVYDIVSFPFPVPMGFAPVMQPEYSVHDEFRDVATSKDLMQPLPMDSGPSMDQTAMDYSATPSRQWP